MNESQTIHKVFQELPAVVVICGHYGAGKTNFALNLAFDMASMGKQVTLIDLDIVNPYFRSSDYVQMLEEAGIALVCPQSAGTALDAPMLSVAIDDEIIRAQNNADALCIIDAGGDDVGATALGRYAKSIQLAPYAMLYVVNAMREQTQTAEDAVELLSEMEYASHLKATHVLNNTHLMQATNLAVVEKGYIFACEVARLLDLPLLSTTIPLLHSDEMNNMQEGSSSLMQLFENDALTCENPYFVRIYVKKPWDD